MTTKLTDEQAKKAAKALKKALGGNRYRSFVEWAGERAAELEDQAQGEVRSFLQCLADDAKKLLGGSR